MTGGYARSFDLIMSEYSLSRDDIFKMPLCTFRQTVETINQRQVERARIDAKITEWSTKYIATIVNMTSQGDKNDKTKMQKHIDKATLGFDEDRVEDDRSLEEIMEEGAIVQDSRNLAAGTFERMTAMLEGPQGR